MFVCRLISVHVCVCVWCAMHVDVCLELTSSAFLGDFSLYLLRPFFFFLVIGLRLWWIYIVGLPP